MSDVPSPKASRQSRPKWLDPKLFLGILLVLGSMALGARIIGQADQTTTVYVAKNNLPANAEVTEEDLASTEVRFPKEKDADQYIDADDGIANNARTKRAIGAGEFVPRDALTNGNKSIVEFPVPVAEAPSNLKKNERVNILLAPKEDSQDATSNPQAPTVLENAVVANPPAEGGAVSGSSSITLRVNLEEAEDFDLQSFYGQVAFKNVVLTRSPMNID